MAWANFSEGSQGKPDQFSPSALILKNEPSTTAPPGKTHQLRFYRFTNHEPQSQRSAFAFPFFFFPFDFCFENLPAFEPRVARPARAFATMASAAAAVDPSCARMSACSSPMPVR